MWRAAWCALPAKMWAWPTAVRDVYKRQPQCRGPRGLYGTAVFLHGALRPVTAARDVQCATGHPDALSRHFVLRDGAGFVLSLIHI